MVLTELLGTLRTSLATQLTGWDVVSNDIPAAKDKLAELVYLEWNATYPDMTTLAFSGRLGIVFYKSFNTSYVEQMDAVETAMLWLHGLSLPGLSVGDNTDVQAIVDRPGVAVNARDELFRVVTINVLFQVIVE